MNRRSLASTNDGGEAFFQPDSSLGKTETGIVGIVGLESHHSPSRSSRLRGLSWNRSDGSDGTLSLPGHAIAPSGFEQPSLSASSSGDMTTKRMAAATESARRRRPIWHISFSCFLATVIGVALLCATLRSLFTRHLEPKGCRMSYMRPSYVHFADFDTEHTRYASKYSLYLYREEGIDDPNRVGSSYSRFLYLPPFRPITSLNVANFSLCIKLTGIPVLFIPGNAGSYKQVRPIAAEAANFFHHHIRHDLASLDSGVRNLDFFTVDFNEDITAFHGQTLLDQAEYLNEAARYILSLYSEPQRSSRDPRLPDPMSVIILGHSMGGVVARAMLVQPNYQPNSINTIITMSAPHSRPPVTFDSQIVRIYDDLNDYWRRAYTQKWASNNPLWHVTLVSIAGGNLDTVVASDYASIESLIPETHGLTVFTTGIPTVWTSMDHQAILWCDQFRKVVAQVLYGIVDVHRASQTKPRAERMRVFRQRLLTGLEANAEKLLLLDEPSTLLMLDNEPNMIFPMGDRLVLSNLGTPPKSRAYLLPVPALGPSDIKRFTFLTNERFDTSGDSGSLDVLFCSIQPTVSSSAFSSVIDLSSNSSTSKKFFCKDAAPDVIHLPASTLDTRKPFYLDQEPPIHPFSYLQYDLEQVAEHQFIAVIDRIGAPVQSFVVAEFSEQTGHEKDIDISLAQLLTTGMSLEIAADHPLALHVKVPSLKSALFAYHFTIRHGPCQGGRALFAPLVRQHFERPYESKYFVNASKADISFHGEAPFVPPNLVVSARDDGLAFTIWSDPTCNGPLHLELGLDILGSLGRLYMRYRTILAAFPLLIVALGLRQQFSCYDADGIFVPFLESLDLSLRRSIPLLLLCLTALSVYYGRVSEALAGLRGHRRDATPLLHADFHRNDYLIGTEDPVFACLIPLIGFVCIGVCVLMHFTILSLTRILGVVYGFLCGNKSGVAAFDDGWQQTNSTAFVSTTPRRRIVSTAILLLLVSTFIPYQFAYLVACLVQLFTVVRALHVCKVCSSTTANANFYHFAHSVLLLMMWVLPINLPILAVWIRNLAVHWLTPFSSHHNVLSIMPFIFLVENLTSGRMVPRVANSLRHVTSGLLLGTALCAAIYGVSHAYILHHLVNAVAAWLVVLQSTSESWSLTGFGTMFEGNENEIKEERKSP